jgi:hypothetical protein
VVILFSSQRPERLWDPPGGKAAGTCSWPLPSSVKFKNNGAIPPFLHTSSWIKNKFAFCFKFLSEIVTRIRFPDFRLYEEESVNRSQMDIKSKIRYIRTRKKKHLFLDISSTNTDTLVPSIYQCVWNPQYRSILTVVRHFRTSVSSANFERPWENFSTQLWSALRDKYFPSVNRKYFFINILWIESFCPQKSAQHNAVHR